MIRETLRKRVQHLGIELQGPRGDQIQALRKSGRQWNGDSNIQGCAGQRRPADGREEEGPLLFPCFDERHRQPRPGRRQDDSREPRPRAEVEAGPGAWRKKGKGGQRLSVVALDNFPGRPRPDERQSAIPQRELLIMSVEGINRLTGEGLRRAFRELGRKGLSGKGRERKRHAEDGSREGGSTFHVERAASGLSGRFHVKPAREGQVTPAGPSRA